jgi:hypothetical protein
MTGPDQSHRLTPLTSHYPPQDKKLKIPKPTDEAPRTHELAGRTSYYVLPPGTVWSQQPQPTDDVTPRLIMMKQTQASSIKSSSIRVSKQASQRCHRAHVPGLGRRSALPPACMRPRHACADDGAGGAPAIACMRPRTRARAPARPIADRPAVLID